MREYYLEWFGGWTHTYHAWRNMYPKLRGTMQKMQEDDNVENGDG